MSAIRLQNVLKQFGGQIVLDGISLELNPGETVGLVGPNGAGKTTLFKLIAGRLEPELGTVTTSKGLEIGYLPQEPEVGAGSNLHDEVASAFANLLELEARLHQLSDEMALQHDRDESQSSSAASQEIMAEYDRVNARFIAAGGYDFERRLNEILGGVGFQPSDYQLPMTALSGGQKCRAALAKLLLQDAQFLLLDEPTNHLDIDAVRWLEKFLAGHHGGAVVISHDRYLLDRVTDRIVEVEANKLNTYPGNYTNYAKAREVRRLTQDRQFEKDAEFIEKERAFIAKHLAGQRSQEAKGRRTRLERRMKAGEFTLQRPRDPRELKIQFEQRKLGAGEVFIADELGKSYGEKRLFDKLSMRITPGMRLGITGPNGTGKSTLLKIMLGLVPADSGQVRRDSKAVVGYFAQESGELDPNRSVLEELRIVRPALTEQQARSYLGRFLFTGDDSFKRISQLSGGEQSRVRLMKLMLQAPDILVLDEPTNHLDIASREVLEEALREFAGAIVAVSHDRYFLDRIVEKLLVIRPEGHAYYNGNYSFYIDQVERDKAEASSGRKAEGNIGPGSAPAVSKSRPAASHSKPAAAGSDRKRSRRDEPGRKPNPLGGGKKSPYLRMPVEELEALIIKKERELEDLNRQFADPVVYKDPQAVTRLRGAFDSLKAELAEIESAWAERIEGA